MPGSIATLLKSLTPDMNAESQADKLYIAIVLAPLFSTQAILMTRDQFIVRNMLTNSSSFCFHVGRDHFCCLD